MSDDLSPLYLKHFEMIEILWRPPPQRFLGFFAPLKEPGNMVLGMLTTLRMGKWVSEDALRTYYFPILLEHTDAFTRLCQPSDLTEAVARALRMQHSDAHGGLGHLHERAGCTTCDILEQQKRKDAGDTPLLALLVAVARDDRRLAEKHHWGPDEIAAQAAERRAFVDRYLITPLLEVPCP